MALNEITYIRMANEILRIVHECDAGMRNGVNYYRNALSQNNPTDALNMLKRAVRLPYRVEARIQSVIDKYGVAAVNSYLAVVSNLTVADLQAELAPLKVYSDTLTSHYQNDGWTQEQIASDIEANAGTVSEDELVPIPVSYVDDM